MKSRIPVSFFTLSEEHKKLGKVCTPYEEVCHELGIQTLAGREALRIALENIKLLDCKQLDYGPRNISGFGVFGVVVRMNDKFERIKNLFNMGRRRRATNEAILDTFKDISNYAIIAEMLDTGKWPNEEPSPKEKK